MIETAASMFGMSIDDVVKIITALTAAVSTIVSVAATALVRLRGARKRAFVKIRRLEDAVQIMARNFANQKELDQIVGEIKSDQRVEADLKDGYDH